MHTKLDRLTPITARRTARFLYGVAFTVVGVVSVSACAAEALAEDDDKNVTAAAPLDVLADSNIDAVVRRKAFNEVLALEGVVRTDALRSVIEEADGEFGTLAVREFIREDKLSGDLLNIVRDASVRWDALYRRVLLQDLSYAREPQRFRLIAEAVLEGLLSKPGRTPAAGSDLGALAGHACEILCRSEDCPSKQLVLDAVKTFRTSRRAWLSAACGGVLDEEGSTLAVRVYRDESIPTRTRMAAASAIASQNDGARDYLLDEVNEFFTKYAGASVGEISGGSVRTERDAAHRYHAFREGLRSLEVLKCLDETMARKVVFAQMTTRNERIRDVLLLVGAMRWPKQLLTFLEGDSEVRAGARILALVAVKNPPLADRCYQLGDETAIRKESSSLRSVNPASFFGSDGIFVRGL